MLLPSVSHLVLGKRRIEAQTRIKRKDRKRPLSNKIQNKIVCSTTTALCNTYRLMFDKYEECRYSDAPAHPEDLLLVTL